MFVARGRDAAGLGRRRGARASASPSELGARRRGERARRRSPCDVVVTVTPGREVLFPEARSEPGQHVALMGADGPGKAEIAVEELAPRADLLRRLGAGEPRRRARCRGRGRRRGARRRHRARRRARRRGRRAAASAGEITLFDSTGLAIQDLAIAQAASSRRRRARPASGSSCRRAATRPSSRAGSKSSS